MSSPASTLSSGALSGRRNTSPRTGLLARIMGLLALRRQRRALAALDAALLKDIGVSPEDARDEAARKLWDVPPGWRI
ncbi:DUF1127 domain-containing protein [Vannielia litorea]|uniref:DUF1127 domain-containing protein n=1 Tax=Vannielia litorea TaxID=1217970 RepID=UPI001BCDE571|nr:DUF1127 domain-containing protein [Vannielia litorea]MBS8228253.1 DUF1127 domain-containing protein [Vannielia litorea]